MKIEDLIRDSESEGAVYFLLTAYIDAVWRLDGASDIHPVMAKLPIAGIDDVEARLEALKAEVRYRAAPGSGELIRESAAVLGAAALRLRSLQSQRAGGLADPPRRAASPAD